MSQHRSLKGQSTIAAKRNVLKRFERVELLTQRGQYKQGDKDLFWQKCQKLFWAGWQSWFKDAPG